MPISLIQPCFAQFDVVKAKTVGNESEKIIEPNVPEMPDTFNDPDLPEFSPDSSVISTLEKKVRDFKERKNKKKNIKELENEQTTNLDEPNKVYSEAQSQEVDDKNKFQINADKITYDDEEGNVYAKGHVEIIAKSQDVVLKADEAVLDKPSQTIKLHDNVKIIKGGVEMSGEYMLVDLNEQNILMDNPTLEAYSFIVNAQEGYLIANDIQMLNGTVKSAKQTEYPFETKGFMRLNNGALDYGRMMMQQDYTSTSDVSTTRKQSYRIDAKEIVITSYKDHNSMLLKKSNIYYNNHKIVHNSDIEIISDKQKQVFETNMPEGGTLRSFGTYIGYGMVYKLPRGQTLKLMPALVYGDSNIGVGIVGRHQTPNSTLEAGWATSTSNLVVRGRYKLGHGLDLRYGRNAYLPEGFMGARRSGYAAQLQYLKSFYVKDIDSYFNHGVYAGVFSDYQKHNQEEAYCTSRFRYLAELRKELLSYENKEQELKIALNALAQGSATLYGSGQTVGVARIGPYVSTKLKGWTSSIGYMLGGIHGDSPFYFDKYRYGKSTIMLDEKFNFNNKFAIGYRANISPLKDNIEEDLLTESRFYAIVGPRDLKVALSYDFVRDVAHVDFMFLIGSDSTKIDFNKLTTRDISGAREKQDFYKNAKRVKIETPENI